MFRRTSIIALLLASTTAGFSGEIETLNCKSNAAAESVVQSAISEPTLQNDQGAQTIALVEGLLASGACTKVVVSDTLASAAPVAHPADGILLGTAEKDGQHVVVFDFVSDVF